MDEDQEQQTRRELRDKVEEAFERLHHVAQARAQTQSNANANTQDFYRNIAHVARGSPTASYTPILTQVLRDVTQRSDRIARMRFVAQSFAGTMGSLFKKFSSSSSSGGGAGKQGLKHPRDSDVVVVLMLGGVTPAELREAQDLVAKLGPATHGKDSILVGGTGIVTPNEVYERVFCNGRNIT